MPGKIVIFIVCPLAIDSQKFFETPSWLSASCFSFIHDFIKLFGLNYGIRFGNGSGANAIVIKDFANDLHRVGFGHPENKIHSLTYPQGLIKEKLLCNLLFDKKSRIMRREL